MPQVQVLPYVPSFGERLAEGINRGVQKGSELYQQHQAKTKVDTLLKDLQDPEKTDMQKISAFAQLPESYKKGTETLVSQFLKNRSNMELLNQLPDIASLGQNQSLPSTQGQQPVMQQQNMLQPNQEQKLQPPGQIQPQISAFSQPQINQGSPNSQQHFPPQLQIFTPEQRMQLRKAAAIGGPVAEYAKGQLAEADRLEDISRLERKEIRDIEKTREKAKTDKEKEVFKKNEPELLKLQNSLKELQVEEMRFSRIEELLKDPSKFPNPTLAAIAINNEGQIRPTASSLLSPEVQEFNKLILDSMSGAQKTFGGKVSNFEAGLYLKKFPGILNTQEGRERTLRDLQLINELNLKHAQGVLDIVEEFGGVDKIPLSKAESIFNKRNKDEIDNLKNRFISGKEAGTFKGLPQAQKYQGRKIKNEKTGEIFISNGKEWTPVNEAH